MISPVSLRQSALSLFLTTIASHRCTQSIIIYCFVPVCSQIIISAHNYIDNVTSAAAAAAAGVTLCAQTQINHLRINTRLSSAVNLLHTTFAE